MSDKLLFCYRCIPCWIFVALTFLFAGGRSRGAVLVTFDDSGSTIIATLSGSLDLVGLTVGRNNAQATPESIANDHTLYTLVSPGHDIYIGTPALLELGIREGVSGGLSKSFGITGNGEALALIVPSNTPFNSVLELNSSFGAWTWNFQNLADIGLGSLTTTPVTVWNNSHASGTAGMIQFVAAAAAVPEPSVLLLGLPGLVLLLHRRRK